MILVRILVKMLIGTLYELHGHYLQKGTIFFLFNFNFR